MRLRWRVRVKVKTYCAWKLFHKEAEVARTFPMGSYYLKKKKKKTRTQCAFYMRYNCASSQLYVI